MSKEKVEIWDCTECGEEDEITFGECWKCSTPHPNFRNVLTEEDEERKRHYEISKLTLRLSKEQIELNQLSKEQYLLEIESARKISALLDKADRFLDNIDKSG